jgi:hypothetical protein
MPHIKHYAFITKNSLLMPLRERIGVPCEKHKVKVKFAL